MLAGPGERNFALATAMLLLDNSHTPFRQILIWEPFRQHSIPLTARGVRPAHHTCWKTFKVDFVQLVLDELIHSLKYIGYMCVSCGLVK
ncbi:MAG: hypothetical protein NZ899_07625 [Thermoguttaceae bacterium]|nr:hypothetical protein [Thermoguttaceae bacterium]MDW8079012.1 hypothetical protein [Thermoguttaceae bacterium]